MSKSLGSQAGTLNPVGGWGLKLTPHLSQEGPHPANHSRTPGPHRVTKLIPMGNDGCSRVRVSGWTVARSGQSAGARPGSTVSNASSNVPGEDGGGAWRAGGRREVLTYPTCSSCSLEQPVLGSLCGHWAHGQLPTASAGCWGVASGLGCGRDLGLPRNGGWDFSLCGLDSTALRLCATQGGCWGEGT